MAWDDGVFVGNLSSRDDPASVDATWLDAGRMQWSGFDRAANEQLSGNAGLRVIEVHVIRQVEPDGGEILPM